VEAKYVIVSVREQVGAINVPITGGHRTLVFIAPSADVADDAIVGEGSKIWDLSQIREGAVVGKNCVIGRGAYVGAGVSIGSNCKLQNLALIYEPAILEDGVFIGPAAVLTNDSYPRAVTPTGELKSASEWTPVGVLVQEGASIGARAVCVAPLKIGRWSLVAAGAVVTRDVGDFSLVAGVPAKHIGWVGKAGHPLISESGGVWVCPETNAQYMENGGTLTEMAR
jgi:UDP-2-acetamido-3-amino-2,3-dideoxy-glucuronate N-acetyltransferase